MPTLLLLASAALACPFCSDPNDVRASAYFNMTMFMSLAPLGLFGLGVWYVWRRYEARS
jgi:hypothetical protein